MTPRKLTFIPPLFALFALFGFGPCSSVALDRSSPDLDGSGGFSDAGAVDARAIDAASTTDAPPATPPPPDTQCYFASYPVGSKHCILAPCYIVQPDETHLSCYGSDDDGTFMAWGDGTNIYLTRTPHETATVYLDAAVTFPVCANWNGQGPFPVPVGSGDYYATGLEYGISSATDIAAACDDVTGSGTSFGVEEPTFSTDQCYYTTFPVGSKQCITAPCQITDVSDGSAFMLNEICGTSLPDFSRAYLSGHTLYRVDTTGGIEDIVPEASPWFAQCMEGQSDTPAPTDPGDYYATGLVVGSASASDLAAYCQ